MRLTDTIVAPATPPGTAIRAIVRVSGPEAFALLAALSAGDAPAHASVVARSLRLADGIDVPTTVYAFVGPRSSTGEDVVEVHLPGSPFLVRRLLDRLLALGARAAGPGEFTARAFFNGKLDLAQAEGVALAIAAAGRRELDAARQLLAGELERRIAPILDALMMTLARVEADIDFADEPVDATSNDELRGAIESLDADCAALLATSARLERLSHEPRIVLTGRPNAGKSTLLNALAGTTRAIVSDVAGTTRDALSARVALARGTVTIVDTAGLDDDATDGAIDRQMRGAALAAVAAADVVVRVVAIDAPDDGGEADLVVYAKSDLVDGPSTDGRLRVSARTGDGLDALRAALDAIAFGDANADGRPTLALNARHVAAVAAVREGLAAALGALDAGPEFVAAGLRRARDHLAEVRHGSGGMSPDDVLGRIFASFCIGK